MTYTNPVVIERDEDGCFASRPMRQGCYSQGDTYGRVIENIREAIAPARSGPGGGRERGMRTFTAVVERCPDTGLYVGWVPGFPGAHSQGETMDELAANMKEVIEMLLRSGEPRLEAEFVGTQNVVVA